MTHPVRIGIVGLRRGLVYAKHLRALAQRGTDVHVTAAFDPRPDRAHPVAEEHEGLRMYDSYSELLAADVDAVIISSPPQNHAEQTILASQAGRSVLCEVPAAVTLDEAQTVVGEVARSGITYMMSSNANYVGFIRSWKGLMRRAALGTVMYAEAEYIHDLRDWMLEDGDGARIAYEERMSYPDRRPTWRAEFPPMHYIPHCMGPLLWLLDDRCVSVSALGTVPTMATDIRSTSDMQVGIFRTSRGSVLRCTLGYAVAREPALVGWFSLYGTLGSLEWRRNNSDSAKAWFDGWSNINDSISIPWSTLNLDAPEEAAAWDDFGRPQKDREWDCDWFVVRDFVDAVAGALPSSPIDVFTAMDYTLPGICAHDSAQLEGQPVSVPDPRDFL